MIETVFRSEDLPAEDRFDHVRELLSLAPVPMDVSSDHTAGLSVHQHDLQLDAIRAFAMTLAPMTFRRTPKLIRRSDPKTYNICLLLDGAIAGSRGIHEAIYRPGELHICNSSQPFELRTHNMNGSISCVGVEIPQRLLSISDAQVNQVIDRPISARQGLGALLGQFLTQLINDTAAYQPSDGSRLGLVATDLTSALIAHHLDADRGLPPDTRERTLILRIRAFIQQHLADPDLTPRSVAAAHHISLSYLHRLFQDEQFTVGAWIRRQRMERARRDLADRMLLPTPIHAIAARWGFPRASDFTRAFRGTYGITPRDYRHQALQSLSFTQASTAE